jgi:polyhydroxybutyrate depolymerase
MIAQFNRVLTVVGLLFVGVPLGTAYAAAQEKLVVRTPDGPRTAQFYGVGQNKPLIVALHGGGGNGAQLARTSGLLEAAAARGASIVFPDGLDNNWGDGRGRGSVNDIAFLESIAAALVSRGAVDPSRVSVTGISNGGMMSLVLACQSDGFRAAAAIVASLPEGTACRLRRPKALLLMNGTADRIVPYDGGNVGIFGRRGSVIGTRQTLRIFAQNNQCDDRPSEQALQDRNRRDGSTVAVVRWKGCAAPVQLYRVDGGGHTLPGSAGRERRITGSVNRDINGAAVIVDFLLSRR